MEIAIPTKTFEGDYHSPFIIAITDNKLILIDEHSTSTKVVMSTMLLYTS